MHRIAVECEEDQPVELKKCVPSYALLSKEIVIEPICILSF